MFSDIVTLLVLTAVFGGKVRVIRGTVKRWLEVSAAESRQTDRCYLIACMVNSRFQLCSTRKHFRISLTICFIGAGIGKYILGI